MNQYRTLDHPVMRLIAWDPARPAEWINDHIAMVHATSNVYLVAGQDGDLVINSGAVQQGARIREKFEALLGRPLRVRKLVFTQSHIDHIGGWEAFAGPEIDIYAQRMFSQIVAERRMLAPFFRARNERVIAAMMLGRAPGHPVEAEDPTDIITFSDALEFSFSDRRFVLQSMASGETLDALAVWLPDEKTVFTGNWAGAIHGALPNFYTARGDRQRSVPAWLRQCRELVSAEPEILITGHGQPVFGRDRIRADLLKVHDAVRYIHDETVRGMNAGEPLSTIAANLCLPDDLLPRDGRCPPRWIVRAVYEEYAGWFHHRRTSELYAKAHEAVWPELVECAGGPRTVAHRAACHLAQGDAERALLMIEVALEVAPADPELRKIELAVLKRLAEEDAGRTFDLLGWIESRILAAEDVIKSTGGIQQESTI